MNANQDFIPKRLAVNLDNDDNRLLIALRAVLEGRLQERLSLSEVVRISLRTQAVREGIIDETLD